MPDPEQQKPSEGLSDKEKEGLKFLERDFNQCFQQMRHYDSQIFEICKFSFTAYTAILGVALGLHQFSVKEHHDFSLTIGAILGTGLLVGFFLFALAVRNRVYFVQVTRYINEQREMFFLLKPMGFSNRSRMYHNPSLPPYFSPRSSQAWFMYLLAILNGVLFFAFLVFVAPAGLPWKGVVSAVTVVLQLIIGICYLNYREDRTAESAVWGESNARRR
jgi:hypothetical protein